MNRGDMIGMDVIRVELKATGLDWSGMDRTGSDLN